MNTRKSIIVIIGLIILGLIVVLVATFWPQSRTPDVSASPTPTVSSIPITASSTATFQVKLGQRTGDLGIVIAPLEVLEDSRCPASVQCIQAGTVRLRAGVTGNATTSQQVFTIGKAIATNGGIITLTDVSPAKVATSTIPSANYIFYFKVTK